MTFKRRTSFKGKSKPLVDGFNAEEVKYEVNGTFRAKSRTNQRRIVNRKIPKEHENLTMKNMMYSQDEFDIQSIDEANESSMQNFPDHNLMPSGSQEMQQQMQAFMAML